MVKRVFFVNRRLRHSSIDTALVYMYQVPSRVSIELLEVDY